MRPGEWSQAAAVGGGADHRLAQQMPGNTGSVRQEGRELLNPHPTRLRPPMVAETVQTLQ